MTRQVQTQQAGFVQTYVRHTRTAVATCQRVTMHLRVPVAFALEHGQIDGAAATWVDAAWQRRMCGEASTPGPMSTISCGGSRSFLNAHSRRVRQRTRSANKLVRCRVALGGANADHTTSLDEAAP